MINEDNFFFSFFSQGGLPNTVLYAENSKVMLTANLWKESGLVNGAQGIIHKVVYSPGTKPPALPAMVLVKVHQYLGPSCIANEEKIVPITPMSRQWFKDKVSCSRKALPLVPSYAMTIHKAQGATLDHVIVNLGDREFACGLCYTGKMVDFLELTAYVALVFWWRHFKTTALILFSNSFSPYSLQAYGPASF